MEKVRDLLNRKSANLHDFFFHRIIFLTDHTLHFFPASHDNLPIHEDKVKGVYVKGLLEVYVSSTEEVYEVMRRGGNNRVVAYTSMFYSVLFPFC